VNFFSEKYKDFGVQDFVLDEYFQLWVNGSDLQCNSFWEEWARTHPHKKDELEDAREFLKQLTFSNYNLEPATVASLWRKIQLDSGIGAERNIRLMSRVNVKYYAAAVLVVASFLTFIFWTSDLQVLEYATTFGETKTITLPDSSTVILNANSKLTFKNQWEEQSSREVWLEGEAYFSVRHKFDHQTFVVKTARGVDVEVLGTEFNVYHRSQETKVVLSSGQISLSFPMQKKEGKILMEPGEMVEFDQNKFKRIKVNTKNYISWRDKVLNLDQTTLREMVRMASDLYGLEIAVDSETMLNQTASGTMPLLDAKSFVIQMSKIFQIESVYENGHYKLKSTPKQNP
jgi:transmembrane sensor